MSWRTVGLAKRAALAAAALLLTSPEVWAGAHVRAGDQPARRPRPAPAPVVRSVTPSPVTISVAVQPPARAAAERVYVDLRGPDGQLRRFPVEGGRDAIQARQVVLHPGESLTVLWTAAK
jgi:hypothetical protein